MTVLKKDYEAVFKEGFKLGTRLARAKINLMRANDSRMIGDEPMEKALPGLCGDMDETCS